MDSFPIPWFGAGRSVIAKPFRDGERGIGVFPASPYQLKVHPYAGVEDFCRSIHSELVSTFGLYTGSLEVGEELAQETLVRVWNSWDKVSVLESPRGWAFRVGFNLGNSWWRRQRVERRYRLSQQRPETAEGNDVADLLAIRAAVASLPRRQRGALVARYFADLSVSDTADLLGCAPGTS
jgi:RNA polymerase sigma factor (sigma-70 family)